MDSFPKQWGLTTIGEVAVIYDGPHATPTKIDHGPIYLNISNLVDGRVVLDVTAHVSEEDFVTWTKRVTPEAGDIAFSYETRIGQAAIIPENLRCCLGRRMGLLRLDRNKVLPEYMIYAYLGPELQDVINANTIFSSTVDRILLTEMPTYAFHLPPLAEQRKIAAILSTWDEAIQLVEALIAALKARKRGLMQRLLTGEVRFPGFNGEWEEVRFSDVLNIEMGGTPSRNSPAYWDDDKITDNRWLTIADLKGKYITDSNEYISDLGSQKSSTVRFPEGTVVMSFKLTIGRAAILAKPCYTNEAICALIPKDAQKVISTFLYHALAIVNFEEELDQAVKGRTLNKSKLARLKLLLPSTDEQIFLTDFLNQIDDGIEMMMQYVAAIREQKKGLMQRLLTGEVRVRVE